MQAKTHLDFIVFHASLKIFVLPILKNMLKLIYFCDNLQKAEKGHVRDLSVVQRDF
jgi:hypothetical protein